MERVYSLTPAERLLSTILNVGVKVDAGKERKLKIALDATLATLSSRQAQVLRWRFGMGNTGPGQTLQDIADGLHLTRERVRQIEVEALRHLRGLDCLKTLTHSFDIARVQVSGRAFSGKPKLVWGPCVGH